VKGRTRQKGRRNIDGFKKSHPSKKKRNRPKRGSRNAGQGRKNYQKKGGQPGRRRGAPKTKNLYAEEGSGKSTRGKKKGQKKLEFMKNNKKGRPRKGKYRKERGPRGRKESATLIKPAPTAPGGLSGKKRGCDRT